MISREDAVEQSVTEYLRNALYNERGYSTDFVELRESFPYKLEQDQLDRNIVAMGFNFDDEGQQAEMGSDLKVRMYTLQWFTFGKTNTAARNLANVLKFAADKDGTIPLLDITQVPALAVDYLIVDGASAHREVVPDPEPWQQFVWMTTVNVTDTYAASLV